MLYSGIWDRRLYSGVWDHRLYGGVWDLWKEVSIVIIINGLIRVVNIRFGSRWCQGDQPPARIGSGPPPLVPPVLLQSCHILRVSSGLCIWSGVVFGSKKLKQSGRYATVKG